jgi:hypothetical protein
MLALAGCAAQTGPYSGIHFVGDPATRQQFSPDATAMQIAIAYNIDFRTGGMAGVIHDIVRCYRETAAHVGDVPGLRDCMILDYTAYNIDQIDGREINGAPLPFFTDEAIKDRLALYGPAAQFDSAAQMLAYLKDMHQLVNRRLVHDWKVDSGQCARNVTDPGCQI